MKSNNNVELYEKQNLIKGKRSSVCTVKFRYIAINVPSGEKKTLFDYFSEIKDDVDFMIHCSLHDDLIFFQRGAIRGGSVSTEGKLFVQNVILRSCAHNSHKGTQTQDVLRVEHLMQSVRRQMWLTLRTVVSSQSKRLPTHYQMKSAVQIYIPGECRLQKKHTIRKEKNNRCVMNYVSCFNSTEKQRARKQRQTKESSP